MTLKRFIAVALALVLLLGALPSALASGSVGSDGHTHSWKDIGRTMQPTCTDYGYRTEVCTVCQQDRQVPLSPLGHYFPNPWKTISEPTCTEAGHEMNTCVRVNRGKACGYEWWREIPALGHDWDEGVITKAPTATEDGEKTYTCLNDPSHTKTEVIPATGGEEKPALTVTWKRDSIHRNKDAGSEEIYYDDPGVLTQNDSLWVQFNILNSGNMDLRVYSYCLWGDGTTTQKWEGELLIPGEAHEYWQIPYDFMNHINLGTETADLIGTVTITYYAIGYDAETWTGDPATSEKLCESNKITRTWKVAKPDEEAKPGLTIEWEHDTVYQNGSKHDSTDTGTLSPEDGAYAYVSVMNSGDVPMNVYTYAIFADGKETGLSTVGLLSPGEIAKELDGWGSHPVTNHITPGTETENLMGTVNVTILAVGYDPVTGVELCKSNEITRIWKVAKPEEEAKPGLKLEWQYDQIVHNGNLIETTNPGILAPDDEAWAFYTITNTGNIPLVVFDQSIKYDGSKNGYTPLGIINPGQSKWCQTGNVKISNILIPGTETEELLGTAYASFYAVGYDPDTYVGHSNRGTELCRTETITRTWKVGKDSPWPIPEDSKLEGTLAVAPGYESSDPAGYQLGEEIETVLTVKNAGLIDLETYGVSDPRDSTSFTDGPIAVSEEKSYLRAHVTVTEEDVERGYIEFPKITISWTDPDSEKERTAFAGPLTVTVLKKTGLLLKKGVAFPPEDGDYFKEGEPIQWSLTVTNNSKDAVTDVTVEDKGKTVGSYAAIAPNDTKNCTVPVHIVTEYDAKVVGYVLNSATATGTDYRGAVHTWPSNVAKALTKKPAVPGEDPKGDPEGLHPAITITKAEDPHGPLNGSYYEANEPIKYIITIKNVGDTELKDIAVTDSLAGFAPIGTKDSLAPNEEKTFDYAYTVKEEDIPYCWIYNSATVTYTFGDGIKGTPKTSNTVQSRVGDDPFPPELPHLDPGKLPEGDDWCRLTLDTLGDTKADYTLHACAEHLEVARAAEEAALSGDWTAAAALWRAEVEELYETLYEAADSELKTVLADERAVYFDYVDSLTALSAEAASNELRMKCAFLCCALHTTPDDLASSLAGDYAQMMDAEEVTASTRIFAPLGGSDSAVTETYAGSIAYAQKNVLGLMNIEKSYNWDEVFTRGAQLWTSALDSEVNPVYKGANKETRKLIALWRISLDSLSAAEKPFLELLYAGNDNAIEETLMNLYKDAALITACIK